MFKNLFNFSFTKKVWNKIGLSVSSDKTSSIRIQAFILLMPVVLASLVFISIELINAIIAWKTNVSYVPSNESIILYGMILSHHISVLFSRSKPQNYYTVDTNTVKDDEANTTTKSVIIEPVANPNVEPATDDVDGKKN